MQRRDNYIRIELAIFDEISFKLIIPSKKNTDKYPKYYIEYIYNGKQHQVTRNIKQLYLQFDKWAKAAKIDNIERSSKLLTYFQINVNSIIKSLGIQNDKIRNKIDIYSDVISSINAFFEYQKNQYAMGDLVGLTNYSDRNKKLNSFLKIHYPSILISELNASVWDDFRGFLKGQSKANSTINQYITYVKSWYNWLINYHEVPVANHANKLRKLDISQQEKKFKNLESEIIAGFFEAVASSDKWLRLELITRLVGENTIRPVQVRSIQAKDINLQNSTIKVYDNKGKKWRTIILTDRVAYLVNKIYENTAKRNNLVGDDDYLIGGYNSFKQGKPYTQNMIKDVLVEPFRKEFPDFEKVNIYDFKHTSITRASRLGNLVEVQNRAGHGKITTTQIYDRSEAVSKPITIEKLISIK